MTESASIWESSSTPNEQVLDSAVDFPTESRLHISLNVKSLADTLPFYRSLFKVNPTKVKAGYAKFETVEPPLNFTLNEFPDNVRAEGQFGLQVKNTGIVQAAYDRLLADGFNIITEDDAACCYAVQTKLWVADPEGNRWEIFVTTEPDANVGCGADCICHEQFERSYIKAG